MTVGVLIEELSKMPEEAEVLMAPDFIQDNGDIRSVIYVSKRVELHSDVLFKYRGETWKLSDFLNNKGDKLNESV